MGIEAKSKAKKKVTPEFIPPDGGYGWVIVLACGMTNFCMVPMIQNFGLIYKDIMKEWEMSTAEYSFILNFQFSVRHLSGLFVGSLLSMYGYRPVAMAGSILIFISTILTSQANKFYQFIIAYSIIGGVGSGMSWSSSALAVNTYFKKRRGIAIGFCWTLTGLSPVLGPILVTWMMNFYDVHGTVLVLSAIILHNLPASLLMHPVQWHAERVKAEDTSVGEELKEILKKEDNMRNSSEKIQTKEEKIQLETSEKCTILKRCHSVDQQNIVSLKPTLKRIFNSVAKIFDLKLLTDLKFLMTFIGVTFAFTGEVNFTMLMPFVLAEKGLSRDNVALSMSLLASMDLVTRFTIPFVSDKFKLDSRLMYSVGLAVLASGRIMFAHLDGFYTTIFISVWCGFGKGFRTIYMALIIPSIVTLERLAAASGLSMFANGLMFSLIGPIFGYIRDNSGNFFLPLYCINILSVVAVLCWAAECIYSKNRRRKEVEKKRTEPIDEEESKC